MGCRVRRIDLRFEPYLGRINARSLPLVWRLRRARLKTTAAQRQVWRGGFGCAGRQRSQVPVYDQLPDGKEAQSQDLAVVLRVLQILPAASAVRRSVTALSSIKRGASNSLTPQPRPGGLIACGEDRGETADLAHLASPAARCNPDSKSSRCSGFGRKARDAVVLGQNGSAFPPAARRRSPGGGDGSEHLL
jgi:hypothetical protein